MKCMTLNTHSWIEEHPLDKLEQLAQFIAKECIDVIALQEVNQRITGKSMTRNERFIPVYGEKNEITEDNFALVLNERLNELGHHYYWSWTCSHIGYDIYHEGVAILSRFPFIPKSVLVSPMEVLEDYHTRKQLVGVMDNDSFVFGSCHYSWWSENQHEGFQYEWQKTLESVKDLSLPTILMGDFNVPAHVENEGYDLVCQTFYDAYEGAKERKGSFTVETKIDGWKDNEESLRIDYGFHSSEWKTNSYEVIFDGKNGPIVSDHFGVMIHLSRL